MKNSLLVRHAQMIRFDFDTGCCNNYRIHFSNIQFVTVIFVWGTLDLA